MSKQNKEELIKEKQALVSQFNILQEKLNSYPISIIVNDNWTFKEEANLKKRIEMRIKEINNLLDTME